MGLSRMRGNSLVRFFEGKAAVTTLTYSECDVKAARSESGKRPDPPFRRRKSPVAA